MATEIELANMAISHLGTAGNIQSLTERSKEAKIVKTFFDIALEATCRDFTMPHTKKFVTLQLVEETPTTEWLYSYRYPNKCVLFKRILSGIRTDTHDSRVPFVQSSDNSGKLIFTDMIDAVAEIVEIPKNLNFFSADFCLAYSFRLAFYIAPSITGGNAFSGLQRDLMQKYMLELGLARQNAANETQHDIEPPSSLELARGDIYCESRFNRRRF